MGQALQRAAQWTSASDGSGGKLEYTPLNQDILNSVLQFVESYSTQHTEEANVIFKKPLIWTTSLTPSSFTGGGYKDVGKDVISDETTDTNEPVVALRSVKGVYELSVFTLAHAAKILSMAKEVNIKEVRACLEANRDPVVNICGERFATVEGEDNSLPRYIDELVRDSMQLSKVADEQNKDEDDAKKSNRDDIKERQKLLNLRLQIARLDEQLLNMSVLKISQDSRVTPAMVDEEVKSLKALCGADPDSSILRTVQYYYVIDGYVYENSCRAPPWRQLHGDICYLLVTPHDGPTIHVTANTAGYFMNGGQSENSKDLNYEKSGDYHKTLVALLKTNSSKFAEDIEKQDFTYKQKETHDAVQQLSHSPREAAVEGSQKKEKHAVVDSEPEKVHKHQPGEKTKKLEPSFKWQTLRDVDDEDSIEQNQPKKKKVPTATLR